MTEQDFKRIVSIHEAGHAVMAIALRKDFATVTIIPNNDFGTFGDIDLGKDMEYKGIGEVIEYTKIYLAGLQAESISQNIPAVKLYLRGGIDMDMNNISNLCFKGMKEDEFILFLQWASHSTRVGLQKLWKYVEAVAAELLKKETLSFAEVKAVMESVK